MLQEFTSVDELRAHYREVRERVQKWKPRKRRIDIHDLTPLAIPVSVTQIRPDPLVITIPCVGLNEILDAVCLVYGVEKRALLSTRRNKEIVRPRHVAYYLGRELGTLTHTQLGDAFGRDRTTILHGCRETERLCRQKPEVAERVAALRSMLEVGA